MIFDSHCHLNDEKLLERVDEVIGSAREAGVDYFLVVGWDKESSLRAIKLAEQYEGIYVAIGFHPENIFDATDEDFEETMSYINHPKVVAVGEIGLDYYWEKDPIKRELQKEWFIKQIDFANDHHKPISIHNRDAFADCLAVLKEHKPLYGGIMHCYSGSVEALKEVLDLGLYIGLGGPVTFTNAKTPKEVAQDVPLDRLVLETDAPYLAPHPLRGTVNEPMNIVLVANEIARLRGSSKKRIAEATTENAKRLFGIE